MLFLLLHACAVPGDKPAGAPADDSAGGDEDPVETEVTFASALPTVPGANLVVIFVDTLRADHLPMYGYQRDTLPTVGGEPWVVVDGFHAVSSWTGPTTASAITGLDPARHGYTWLADSERPPPITARTIFQDLGAAGYTTAVFTANGILGDDDGMAAGVDEYWLEGKVDGVRDASNHLALALDWIDRVTPGPFAVWVQPMDMHAPYSPAAEDLGTWSDPDLGFATDAEWDVQEEQIAAAYAADSARTRDQVRDVYDEQLLGLDRSVRIFLDGLAARGLLEDTVVVLAADHGESLDDAGDGVFGHYGSLRYELLDVPFLVRHPTAPAAEVPCLSQSSDFAPTLLALLAVPSTLGDDGRRLQEGCRDVSSAAFWNADALLQVVGEADETFQIVRECTISDTFHDLRGDAHGVPVVAEDEVPDAELRRASLEDYVETIVDAVPGSRCPGAPPASP